jgi:hypothetical protein
LTGSVWFQFYKPEIEKPEPNQTQTEKNRAKLEKTESDRFEPIFPQNNQTESKPVGLNRFWLFFFYKNRTESKIITPTSKY